MKYWIIVAWALATLYVRSTLWDSASGDGKLIYIGLYLVSLAGMACAFQNEE